MTPDPAATLKCPEAGCDYTSPEPADPPECPTHERGLIALTAEATAPGSFAPPVEDAGSFYREGYDDGYAAAAADLKALDAQEPAEPVNPEPAVGEATGQTTEALPEGSDPAPFIPAE